jgi:hypothetical protein
VFSADGGTTTLTATYGGDPGHNTSGGTFGIVKSCIDPATGFAICTDPSAPTVCGPIGTIFPQCAEPTEPPEKCKTVRGKRVCEPLGTYVTACGSIGTLLPPCNIPPPPIPGVCGPPSTGLPPCASVNNPVTVCGPSSGTPLPGCSFSRPITGPVTGLDDSEGGDIDVTVSCSASDATESSVVSPGAHTAKKQKGCDFFAAVDSLRKAKKASLHNAGAVLGQAIYKGTEDQCDYACKLTGAFAFVQAAGRQYAGVTRDTADIAIVDYFGDNQLVGPSSQNEVVREEGCRRDLAGPYEDLSGSFYHFSAFPNPRSTLGITTPYRPLQIRPDLITTPSTVVAAGLFIKKFCLSFSNYIDFMKARAGKMSGATAAARSTPTVKPRGPLASVRGRLRVSKKRRVHIRLSPSVVRALVHENALARGIRRRVVPIRIIVVLKAKPRPVLRFVDLAVQIKHKAKPGKKGKGRKNGRKQKSR